MQQWHENYGGPPEAPSERLVASSELPRCFQGLFSFQWFNQIQSELFGLIMTTDKPLCVSAPTGAGA